MYFGFRNFKQSEDGHLGIFKGLTELFLDAWKKIRKDRFVFISILFFHIKLILFAIMKFPYQSKGVLKPV